MTRSPSYCIGQWMECIVLQPSQNRRFSIYQVTIRIKSLAIKLCFANLLHRSKFYNLTLNVARLNNQSNTKKNLGTTIAWTFNFSGQVLSLSCFSRSLLVLYLNGFAPDIVLGGVNSTPASALSRAKLI